MYVIFKYHINRNPTALHFIFLNFSTLILRQVQLEIKVRAEIKDFVEINCRTEMSIYM